MLSARSASRESTVRIRKSIRLTRSRSAVMSALAIAQDETHWLATEVMDFVAHYLGMPPIASVTKGSRTFYEMYNTEPTGKATKITNLH